MIKFLKKSIFKNHVKKININFLNGMLTFDNRYLSQTLVIFNSRFL